jgi:hypothetical protein
MRSQSDFAERERVGRLAPLSVRRQRSFVRQAHARLVVALAVLGKRCHPQRAPVSALVYSGRFKNYSGCRCLWETRLRPGYLVGVAGF